MTDLRLGLRVIAYGDAFRAGKRGNKYVDFVLLNEFLGGAHRRIRTGVRRTDDGFDFLATGLAAVRFNRQLVAAHAVFAKNRIGAFESCRNANFELVGGVGRTTACSRGQSDRDRNSNTLVHWGFPPDVRSPLGRIVCRPRTVTRSFREQGPSPPSAANNKS
jgi:hypothetical protein